MKISKLFHWLYATLMFLPLVFFVPSVFYYGFNEHATNTETTTINYKYESNEVNTLDDLVIGNIYEFDFPYDTLDTYFYLINDFNVDILYTYEYDFDSYNIALDEIMPVGSNDAGNVISNYTCSNNIGYFNFYLNQNEDYLVSLTIGDLREEQFSFHFIGILQACIGLTNYSYISYTDYNVIESVSVNTDDTITDKVATAWDSIWNLPVFSWTQNSFVSAPFAYITGLFGLQANNSLNYVFTYFCSISICWLVFDLLMYVPNLAHRWLDKGAIE